MSAANRDSYVFINCPFDQKYLKLLHAIVFAVHDLGFQARHSLIDDGTAIRLARIAGEIKKCRYSIHDISRVEVGGTLNLPRFNMPFEAGIAYAMHAFPGASGPHHLLFLDSAPYRYQASLSDVAGLDPKIHNGKPEEAIEAVRAFLKAKSGIADLPGAAYIIKRHALFFSKLPPTAKKLKLNMKELESLEYVNDLQAIMIKWIANNPA